MFNSTDNSIKSIFNWSWKLLLMLVLAVFIYSATAGANVCFVPGGQCAEDDDQPGTENEQCLGYDLENPWIGECDGKACEMGWDCESCTNASGVHYKCEPKHEPGCTNTYALGVYVCGLKECPNRCDRYEWNGYSGTQINGKCTATGYEKTAPGNPGGKCYTYIMPDYNYKVSISGKNISYVSRHDCFDNTQIMDGYSTTKPASCTTYTSRLDGLGGDDDTMCYTVGTSIGDNYTTTPRDEDVFVVDTKYGTDTFISIDGTSTVTDTEACYKATDCNTANGWEKQDQINPDIFNFIPKNSDGIYCRKATSCKNDNYWYDYDSIGQYTDIYFKTDDSGEHSGFHCYQVRRCADNAYDSEPDSTYFTSSSMTSNGKTCWIITGKAQYAYANEELPKYFEYENKSGKQFNPTTKTFENVTYYRIKQCKTPKYAYDEKPDERYFTHNSQTRKKLGENTDITCWHVTGRASNSYAAQQAPTYFKSSSKTAYLNGTSDTVTSWIIDSCLPTYAYTSEEKPTYFVYAHETRKKNGSNDDITCYNITGCYNRAYASSPDTRFFTVNSVTRKKNGVNTDITCWHATGRASNAYASQQGPTYFNSTKQTAYKNGTDEVITSWIVDGCLTSADGKETYAYPSKPDETYFNNTSATRKKNGSADDITCYNVSGCATGVAYTKAQDTVYFINDSSTKYKNGSTTKLTCYRVKSCATNAHASEPNTTYFTSTSLTRKKLGTTTDITCWIATDCKSPYINGHSSANSCGVGGSVGWDFDGKSTNKSDGSTLYCGKCDIKDGCTEGFVTSIQSVDNCGVSKAAGWSYSTSGYYGNTTCGKCTPVNNCESGFNTSTQSCSKCNKWSQGGWYGDTKCGKCSSFGYGYEVNEQDTKYFKTENTTQVINASGGTRKCYRATACTDAYTDGYSSATSCGDGGSIGWDFDGKSATKSDNKTLYCGKCTIKNGCTDSTFSKDTQSCDNCNKWTQGGWYGNTKCGKCISFGVGYVTSEPSTTYFKTENTTETINSNGGTRKCYRATDCATGKTPDKCKVADCGTRGTNGWTYAGSSATLSDGSTLCCGTCTKKTCPSGFTSGTESCSGCKEYSKSTTFNGDAYCGKCTSFGTGYAESVSTTYFKRSSLKKPINVTGLTSTDDTGKRTCYLATECASGKTAGVSGGDSCGTGTGKSNGWTADYDSATLSNGNTLYCGTCSAKTCPDGFTSGVVGCSGCNEYSKSSTFNGDAYCGKCTSFGTGYAESVSATYFKRSSLKKPINLAGLISTDNTGKRTCYLATGCADGKTSGISGDSSCGNGTCGSNGWAASYDSATLSNGNTLYCGTCSARSCNSGYTSGTVECTGCKEYSYETRCNGDATCGKCASFGTGYVTSLNAAFKKSSLEKVYKKDGAPNNKRTCYVATGCATGYTEGLASVSDCGTTGANGYDFTGYSATKSNGDTIYCGKCTSKPCPSGFTSGTTTCGDCEEYSQSSTYNGTAVCGKCVSFGTGYVKSLSNVFSKESKTAQYKKDGTDNKMTCYRATGCANGQTQGKCKVADCGTRGASGWSYSGASATLANGNTICCGVCSKKSCPTGYTSGTTSCSGCNGYSNSSTFNGDAYCGKCESFGTGYVASLDTNFFETESASGYKDNTYKGTNTCVRAKKCNSNMTTGISSASDCGTTGTKGWDVVTKSATKADGNSLSCGGCSPKKCEGVYSTSTTTCSGCSTYDYDKNHFYGDTKCGVCIANGSYVESLDANYFTRSEATITYDSAGHTKKCYVATGCASSKTSGVVDANSCGNGTCKGNGWTADSKNAKKSDGNTIYCGTCTKLNCPTNYVSGKTSCGDCEEYSSSKCNGDSICGRCVSFGVGYKTSIDTTYFKTEELEKKVNSSGKKQKCYRATGCASGKTEGVCSAANCGNGTCTTKGWSATTKSETKANGSTLCCGTCSKLDCPTNYDTGTTSCKTNECYKLSQKCGNGDTKCGKCTYQCTSAQTCCSGTCKTTASSGTKPATSQPCGCNGTQTRTVTWDICSQKWVEGKWSACSSTCPAEKTCVNGICQWGDCSGCSSGQYCHVTSSTWDSNAQQFKNLKGTCVSASFTSGIKISNSLTVYTVTSLYSSGYNWWSAENLCKGLGKSMVSTDAINCHKYNSSQPLLSFDIGGGGCCASGKYCTVNALGQYDENTSAEMQGLKAAWNAGKIASHWMWLDSGQSGLNHQQHNVEVNQNAMFRDWKDASLNGSTPGYYAPICR